MTVVKALSIALDRQLKALTGQTKATFRPGQREAIEALAFSRQRVVLVQRTGWGKSAVYFLTTRLLRDQGCGPTLILSPLLALMRNQLQAAARVGLRAESINSTNPAEHEALRLKLERNEVDLLLVAPERLANQEFVKSWLPLLTLNPGLLVIDEVHCISDWGHDFRPDYRRIKELANRLPPKVPILGCTATANNRVVSDVVEQLGAKLVTQRGPLDRQGLHLAVLDIPSQAARLGWLVENVPNLPRSGIVYCLTVADTRIVADFLNEHGINVLAYNGDDSNEWRVHAEDRLLRNQVKALVATSALGMGFDKPDVGFVIHYQAPGTPITYYQQVGRAGRALPESFGILLRGHEDERIQDYFIDRAFPAASVVEQVLATITEAADPPRIGDIEATVNISRGRLETVLKQLEVDGYLSRNDRSGYVRTRRKWVYPHTRFDAITKLRRMEQAQMARYATTNDCRMRIIRALLDDSVDTSCGICDRCAGPRFTTTVSRGIVAKARRFLRSVPIVIEPRTTWPMGLSSVRGRINSSQLVEPGRAACRLHDDEFGRTLRSDLAAGKTFSEELIDQAVLTVKRWNPSPRPQWVTFVPSQRPGDPIERLAQAIAKRIGVPCHSVVRVAKKRPQSEMQNSAQQVMNTFEAFFVESVPDTRPVLLVDDVARSRWTLTVVGRALRRAGATLVLPLACGAEFG